MKLSAPSHDPTFVRSPALVAGSKALIRDLRNYLAGQVVGITRDDALLDEVLKCAFCKVRLERQGVDTRALDAEQLCALYLDTLEQLRQDLFLLDLGSELRLGPPHIARIDDVLGQLDLLDPARDVVGDLYETFAGSSIRGQEGQFFTPKNAVQTLVAMVRPGADDSVLDPACGAGAFLMESARFSLNINRELPSLSGVDKDAYLARLARIHVALQFGVEPQVSCANSLAAMSQIADAVGHSPTGYSVVLTNPPFGSKIVAVAGADRGAFALAHKWRKGINGSYEQTPALSENTAPQILFVERCLQLLAEGGRLGIVLPESVLSNVGHRYMVQYLLERVTPRAIIGMPESLFKTSGKGGTHTKVCLAVFEKRPSTNADRIFMAEARWCGHDSRGLPIERDDLPAIIDNYEAFRTGKRLKASSNGFVTRLRDLRSLVLTPRYYDPAPRQQLAKLKHSHLQFKLGDLIDKGSLRITSGHEVGKNAYGGGDIPFVRTSDLSNWEIKVDPKHTVGLDTFDALAAKQDVQEGDVLMVRDGTYLIGTCAMVTKHDVRIVFQSHIVKMRLTEDAPLDEFLLLAALSSPPVRSQIRANSFTLDIIDSLGDRVRDLVLPIPASEARRNQISAMVRRVIAERVEARELARRAALEIAAVVPD
jgi:type I restriction enzyme M protein